LPILVTIQIAKDHDISPSSCSSCTSLPSQLLRYPLDIQIAPLSLPVPPLYFKSYSCNKGLDKGSKPYRLVILAVLPPRLLDLPRVTVRVRLETLLLVPVPVLALALGPAVEDEIAGALELAAWRAAAASHLWVLEEVRHGLLFPPLQGSLSANITAVADLAVKGHEMTTGTAVGLISRWYSRS
jgi:hypothetical protein